MTLHDVILADASKVFCNVNDFGETVTYYNRDVDAREIKAVVVRDALAILPEAGDVVTPVFEVHVVNSMTLGISSDEIDLGGDLIEFPVRHGQEPSRRSIIRKTEHDEGMLGLECR